MLEMDALDQIVYILVPAGVLSAVFAIFTSVIGIVYSTKTLNKISLFGIREHRTITKVALFLSIGGGGGTLLLTGALMFFLYMTGFF